MFGLLVAFLAGALSSLPWSIIKSIPMVSTILRSTGQASFVKIAAALGAAAEVGAQASQQINDQNSQAAYAVGAAGALVMYGLVMRYAPVVEKWLRTIGESIPLGSHPPILAPLPSPTSLPIATVPAGPGSGPGGLMPPTTPETAIVVALKAAHPEWTQNQLKTDLLLRGYTSGW